MAKASDKSTPPASTQSDNTSTPPASTPPADTQPLRPSLVADEEQVLPPEKVEATYTIQPEVVRDPDIIAQTKRDANERRHLAAQLPDKVKAAVYGYLDRHSGASKRISNSAIARWLQQDNPETAPLVAHLKPKSLADKIGALRK
jgi:hypothetical protein